MNQLYEAKKHLKRSTELTKNELPYIALAKMYLLEDHVTEAQNAYMAALRYVYVRTIVFSLLFFILMYFIINFLLTS